VTTNIFLNYVLIFGHFGAPRRGLRGAALASLISAYVNIAVLYGISYRQKNAAIAPIAELVSFDRSFVYRYIGISLPVFINELCWGTGRTVLMMIFGRQGTDNFAALTALRTIEGR
jgi:Na+-driven multidrug efflux pump